MATILLAGVDLYFRGKLEALLKGHHLVSTDGVDPPDVVICDIARIDPDEVADGFHALLLDGMRGYSTP